MLIAIEQHVGGCVGKGCVRHNFTLDRRTYIPPSPLRKPQTAGFEEGFWRRKSSGSKGVGLGVKPLMAAYTRSVTGVGRGPSNVMPYADALNARRVANFIL